MTYRAKLCLAALLAILSLGGGDLYAATQESQWHFVNDPIVVEKSGADIYGNLPATGPFTELATAHAVCTIGSEFEESGTYDIPLPMYSDGAQASPSEVFFVLTFKHAIWRYETYLYLTYIPGEATFLCNWTGGGRLSEECSVDVFALRSLPVVTSPTTLGRVKSGFGQ